MEYRDHLSRRRALRAKSEEAIAKKRAETERFLGMYKNPVFNVAMTFLEPLPVAVIVALVSAGVLSRRQKSDQGVRALDPVGSRALNP